MQFDLIKPTLKAPASTLYKLRYEDRSQTSLSMDFNCKLRCYNMASDIAAAVEAVAEDTVADEDADAFLNLARDSARRVLLDAVDGTYRGCEAGALVHFSAQRKRFL